METVSVSSILTNIGVIFTQCVEWIGTLSEAIVTNPLLLICVIGFLVVGFVVGLLARILRA